MHTLTTDHRELIHYPLRLPGFEGPFDVLLRLIDRQQLPITDVSLVMVTDQFLNHMVEMGGAPPQVVAEFAAVGARLVQIKARSLLPRPQVDDSEETPADLIVQLMEYKRVKEAAWRLAQLDALGALAFSRGERAVSNPPRPAEMKLAVHHPQMLARALRRRLSVVEPPAQIVPFVRLVTLQELVGRIVDRVKRGPANFETIAAGCDSNHEVRTAFLALLVLVRRRVVDAEQDEPFGEIVIRENQAAGYGVSLHEAMLEFGE